ncbi:MAG: hypothetical protein KC994_05145, partial [Candidatus Omnitrophica bacterium]|nr:hypothetical protein [Candidatus Omnitrophota bacterium]
MYKFKRQLAIIFLIAFIPSARAEIKSVKETMDGIVDRLYENLSEEELFSLTDEKIQSFITPEERQSLATQHVKFEVNVPVVVSVMHHKDQP